MEIIQQLKKQRERYRQWKLNPFDHSFKDDEEHRCFNCGHTFKGNFCPYCGQKATHGPIGWKSTWQEFLNVWGMGGRSLLYSLWQLLWRPGYFISDYISGRRQVSFPPVKMLFICALFFVLLKNYVLPHEPVESLFEENQEVGPFALFDSFADWNDEHRDWGMLITGMFLLIPTWILFRLSPRHTRHTLPQGFFIQVFVSILLLILTLLSDLIPPASPLVPVWIIVTYKQLFSYGWWGTTWRAGMVYLGGLVLSILFVIIYDVIDHELTGNPFDVANSASLFVIFFFAMLFLLAISDVINRRLWKKYTWWGITWRTIVIGILLFIALLVSAFFIEVLTDGWEQTVNEWFLTEEKEAENLIQNTH